MYYLYVAVLVLAMLYVVASAPAVLAIVVADSCICMWVLQVLTADSRVGLGL